MINPIHQYSGKSKCHCGSRAKWRVFSGKGIGNYYACNNHKFDLKKFENNKTDSSHITEADSQTWGKL
jgi:hypothetical protein